MKETAVETCAEDVFREALRGLLAQNDITAEGECRFCRIDYVSNAPKHCANDKCPAFIARAALNDERRENALEDIRLQHEKDDIATSPIAGEHGLLVDEILDQADVGRLVGKK